MTTLPIRRDGDHVILTCPDGYELRMTLDEAREFGNMVAQACDTGARYVRYKNVYIWLTSDA